jgi:2-alkenal reductase
VVVVRTAPGSPAERAGLRGVNTATRALGDVIVGVDGQPVHRLADLTNQLEQVGVGKSVELALNRNGSKTNVKVEVTDVTPPR